MSRQTIGHRARRLVRALGATALLVALLALAVAPAGPGHAQDAIPAASPAADRQLGLSRQTPAAPGEEVISEGYAVTLLETLQGEAATARVAEADQFNPPPSSGQEYVLVRVRVRNAGDNPDPLQVSPANFGLTGSAARLYPASAVVPPRPELRGQVPREGQVEGCLVLPVIVGEPNRELVLIPGAVLEPATLRYLALEPGASIPVGGTPVADPAATSVAQPGAAPSDAGTTRDAPAPFQGAVITDRFAVQVVESVRGTAAAARLTAANEFNPAPLPDNEHVVVRVRVTYLGPDDGPVPLTLLDLGLIGGANVRYSQTGLVPPEPEFDVLLYQGGTGEGNAAFEIRRNETSLSLIFEPMADPAAEPRYLLIGAETATPTP